MRIALGVEYNGAGFYGWQSQPGLPTIQNTLQDALQKVADESIFLFCAGRTDANVHATGQVVHFDSNAKRHIDAWIWGTNAHLPPNIVVRWAKQVDYSFHARFSALSRRYRYIVFNHPIRPALLHHRTAWYYYPLHVDRMQEAASYLLGELDFSSFRSSKCNSKSPMRHVTTFNIQRSGDFVLFEVEANAFLHHMVRNMVGTLLKVGSGSKTPDWVKEVLEAKSRKAAAETASAEGLYLVQINYPTSYSFPLSSFPFLI